MRVGPALPASTQGLGWVAFNFLCPMWPLSRISMASDSLACTCLVRSETSLMTIIDSNAVAPVCRHCRVALPLEASRLFKRSRAS